MLVSASMPLSLKVDELNYARDVCDQSSFQTSLPCHLTTISEQFRTFLDQPDNFSIRELAHKDFINLPAWTKTKTMGMRGSYSASSAAWNALPVHLHDPEPSLNSFRIKLKTHFFSRRPPSWIIFIIHSFNVHSSVSDIVAKEVFITLHHVNFCSLCQCDNL